MLFECALIDEPTDQEKADGRLEEEVAFGRVCADNMDIAKHLFVAQHSVKVLERPNNMVVLARPFGAEKPKPVMRDKSDTIDDKGLHADNDGIHTNFPPPGQGTRVPNPRLKRLGEEKYRHIPYLETPLRVWCSADTASKYLPN